MFHSELKQPLDAANINFVLLVGEEMAALVKALAADVAWTGKFAHCGHVQDAIIAARKIIEPGDAVLVKGSNSMGLSTLVDAFVSGGI